MESMAVTTYERGRVWAGGVTDSFKHIPEPNRQYPPRKAPTPH